jgi:tetratricopeptide (TPR) repeat protein
LPSESIEEPKELAALFPDSLLLTYLEATCPGEDEELLSLILAYEPQFYEAAYHLGMLSLSRGNLLQAEGYFLKMHEGIPESAQATILLASIAFALEEVERSLEFYEKTLDILPNYRDALLGKAICLSTLDRPEEAVAACEKIIALGYWLLGESYYWIAWNQHELKADAAAEMNIEQAKGRLPTSSEVFTLSGLIAIEREDLAKAEKEFQEALRYDPSRSDVLFNLGDLAARKEDWPNSGLYFEKAGFAFENEGEVLREKILEVEKSTLAPQRKKSLISKRRSRLEKMLLSRATSFYNAAAGYFNAGQKFKALEMATRSAEHPAFKEKAEELVSGIK